MRTQSPGRIVRGIRALLHTRSRSEQSISPLAPRIDQLIQLHLHLSEALRISSELPAHPLEVRVHELAIDLQDVTGQVIVQTARVVPRQLERQAHEAVPAELR